MASTGLHGQVVLVTGASGGIGGAIVSAFLDEQARVVAHYRRHRDRAEATIRGQGDHAIALGADLTREDEVARLFRTAEERLGPVTVLIANAGYWPPTDVPIHQMSLSQWEQTLATNLTATFLCLREFARGVERHRLSDVAAVLIGSTAALFGEAGHADYSAAKAGLTYGLLRTFKNELCRLTPRGRVNAICPGWTKTPLVRDVTTDADRVRRVLQTVPLRRMARPEDVAATAVYLASPLLARHVTGQIITVAGGMEGRVLYSPDEIDPDQA